MTEEQINKKEQEAINTINVVKAVKCIVIEKMTMEEACLKNSANIEEVERWLNGTNNIIAKVSPQRKGVKKNTLLRYKKIKELYDKHKTDDIPDTVILRKYICPTYPISRTTLYQILTTSINKDLAELDSVSSKK